MTLDTVIGAEPRPRGNLRYQPRVSLTVKKNIERLGKSHNKTEQKKKP